MSKNLLGQQVLSAREMGLVPLGNVKHLYGNTATVLERPDNATAIVLDVESGSFRAQVGDTATATASATDLFSGPGAFDDAYGWTLGDGWSISGGEASSDATQAAVSTLSYKTDTNFLFTGYTYRIDFTVSDRTAGSITPVVGGTDGSAVSSNGAANEDIVAGTADTIAFKASADFDGTIDGVEVRHKQISASAPSASNADGGGTIKLRADQPVVTAAPSSLTVVGSGASDILTYYWI